MKLFTCCLLLLFATMVVTAPVRVQRENVFSFLNDALGTTTEKTAPAHTTVYRKPPSKPEKEQESKAANSFTDVSEANSMESFNTNGLTGPEVSDKNGGESKDAIKGPDSDEIMTPEVVEKDKTQSRRKTNVGPKDMSSRLVQDRGSREHSGPHREQQASRELTDLNSEEGVMVNAQGAENVSGKQVIHSSRDQMSGSLQRKGTPGGAHGLNGMQVPDRSRELLDQDSLEGNNGRPAPVGNRGDTDYDETREFISSESYLIAPPEHMPRSLSVLAESRAS